MQQHRARTGAADHTPRARADRSKRVMTELRSILHDHGVHAALGFLNARTRFRFTGIFQVDPPLLRNIHLFDRENPTLNVSGAVSSVDIGYCGIASATNAPFRTRNARRDPRLMTHPARDSMLAYAGVPIRLPSGAAWGTLCHFDWRPRLMPPGELPLLEAAVSIVTGWLVDAVWHSDKT